MPPISRTSIMICTAAFPLSPSQHHDMHCSLHRLHQPGRLAQASLSFRCRWLNPCSRDSYSVPSPPPPESQAAVSWLQAPTSNHLELFLQSRPLPGPLVCTCLHAQRLYPLWGTSDMLWSSKAISLWIDLSKSFLKTFFFILQSWLVLNGITHQ